MLRASMCEILLRITPTANRSAAELTGTDELLEQLDHFRACEEFLDPGKESTAEALRT